MKNRKSVTNVISFYVYSDFVQSETERVGNIIYRLVHVSVIPVSDFSLGRFFRYIEAQIISAIYIINRNVENPKSARPLAVAIKKKP